MTGLGAYRRLTAKGVKVTHFIDSDPGLEGLKILGCQVLSPQAAAHKFTSGVFDTIVITAILKSEDILKAIESEFTGPVTPEIFLYGSADTPSYTIDILGACNLKCGSCPHSIPNHEVPKGSMTLETFKKVLNKALCEAPALSHISLYSWGDPLLHPYLGEIINFSHSKNLALAISSNLSMNLDGRLEDIVKASPDYFKISVSGYSQKIYETTHQGGDINLVKSNLYRLRYLMDRHKKTFLVDINYHLYRNNCDEELQNFKSLANELGFVLSETYALVMPLERVFNYLDGDPDFNTTKLNEDLLLVTVEEGIEASGGKGMPQRSCPFRENQININADLSVPICCVTFERSSRTIVSGNYLNSELDVARINELKSQKDICIRCQQEGLPEYNLGFNRTQWIEYAQRRLHQKP